MGRSGVGTILLWNMCRRRKPGDMLIVRILNTAGVLYLEEHIRPFCTSNNSVYT